MDLFIYFHWVPREVEFIHLLQVVTPHILFIHYGTECHLRNLFIYYRSMLSGI